MQIDTITGIFSVVGERVLVEAIDSGLNHAGLFRSY